MASNGHEKSVQTLKREAAVRRAALRRTASALEDRLRFRGHQMSETVEKTRETVERTRERLEGVDSFIHRHRYAILGGALGVGLVLGLRRQRRPVRARNLEDAVRLVVQRQRPSMLRSLVGGAAAVAVRYGLSALSERLMPEDPSARYEPLLLPPGRPYAE